MVNCRKIKHTHVHVIGVNFWIHLDQLRYSHKSEINNKGNPGSSSVVKDIYINQ